MTSCVSLVNRNHIVKPAPPIPIFLDDHWLCMVQGQPSYEVIAGSYELAQYAAHKIRNDWIVDNIDCWLIPWGRND